MKHVLVALMLFGICPLAFSEESVMEKTESKVNDAKREVKKTYHRAKEKVCAKGDVACVKEKAQHRGTEAKDYLEDKTNQIKNKVD